VTTASADATLKTWDVRTGALIATHKGHTGVVNSVAVAPAPGGEGEVVVSGGDEGVSLIWKV
jgi:ribosome assembly protein SQT1